MKGKMKEIGRKKERKRERMNGVLTYEWYSAYYIIHYQHRHKRIIPKKQ